MTKDSPNSRMIAYLKGSIPIERAAVIDATSVEKDLIRRFTEAFVLRREYGKEYFTGPIMKMLLMFNSVVAMHRINARMNIYKPYILKEIEKERVALAKKRQVYLLYVIYQKNLPHCQTIWMIIM